LPTSSGSTAHGQADSQDEQRRQSAIGAATRIIEAARVALEAGDEAGAEDLLNAIKAPTDSLQASVSVLMARIADSRRSHRLQVGRRDTAEEMERHPVAAAPTVAPVDAPETEREAAGGGPAAEDAAQPAAEAGGQQALFQQSGTARAGGLRPMLLAGFLLVAAVVIVAYLLR
jgi:hypothetical protein